MTMSLGGLEIGHLVDIEPLAVGRRPDLVAATDLRLDRRVAVRMLAPLTDPDDRSRFLERARAAGALSGHPNIVTVFDAGVTDDDRPYLVMELVEEPTLAERLERSGPRPWTEAVDLTLQLAAGLAPIHEAGSLYRDLRPENVLLTGARVKLGDLGLFPMTPPEPDSPTSLAHRAREAIDGRGDERSDLYALTSLLYQVIDGRAPFWRPDDTVDALTERIRTQAAPPLDPDLVPPALAVFIAAGLSADPFDRPQSAAEFSRELDLIRQGRTTGSTPSVLHRTTGAVPVTTDGSPSPSLDARPTPLPSALSPAPVVASALDRTEVLDASGHTAVASAPTDAGAWPPPGPEIASAWSPPVGPADMASVSNPPAPLGVHTASPATTVVAAVEPEVPLIPVEADGPGPAHRPGPERSPLLIGAAAMILVGLIGLVAVVALGLRNGETDTGSAAPALTLPGGSTEAGTEGDGVASDQPSTTLTPLAMLAESTTSTVTDGMVTSTDTTVRRVNVPNLVGLEVAGAGDILSEAGLEVLVVGRVSPGSLPGTVIQQTPAAGTSIELPATVTLFIPRSSTLPFMIGRPADTVCLQLEALGLTCERNLRFDDRVPAGAVIATDPAEGTSFSEGQTIRLQVSRGPLVEVAVPQVAGQSEADARATLGQAGFVAVTIASQASDNVPAGQAIGTDPAAGTQLGIDQPVVIRVSTGPAPVVAVPDLIGLDRAGAEAALAAAQLTGEFVGRDLPAGDPGVGVVVATDPVAGTEVATGSTVTVTIGQATMGSTTTTMDATSTTAAEAPDG